LYHQFCHSFEHHLPKEKDTSTWQVLTVKMLSSRETLLIAHSLTSSAVIVAPGEQLFPLPTIKERILFLFQLSLFLRESLSLDNESDAQDHSNSHTMANPIPT
jgi:hypothetical protein